MNLQSHQEHVVNHKNEWRNDEKKIAEEMRKTLISILRVVAVAAAETAVKLTYHISLHAMYHRDRTYYMCKRHGAVSYTLTSEQRNEKGKMPKMSLRI